MTSRTLFALISAAMVWNLPNITLAQAMQGSSESGVEPATDAKEDATGNPVLQMPARKAPVKAKPKPKKPARPAKGRTPPQQAPFFPPAPPTNLPDSGFGAPLPEERGFFDIWGDDPTTATTGTTEDKNQLGLLGVGNYLGTGGGLEYLRRSFSWMDWGLQVTSTQARLTNSQNPQTDEFLSTRMTSARLTSRVFNSRWLYLGTGLSFNSVQGRYGWEGPGVANEEIAVDFTAQMILLDVVLGSQWEPGKGFYIAMDWVGFGGPVAGTLEYDIDSDLDDLVLVFTGSTTEERIQKELGAQFRPFYGVLKVGYMF
ncbi:hypothetical protein [Oligoflexus tunisiensis]|uniref:hypothetical protein n=1 Tax=Oligoflexus tunisiensis TaxID=708132 RepID=UPI00114CDC78|nr:hypothetical protein [Oligoflexus tunisiensis]